MTPTPMTTNTTIIRVTRPIVKGLVEEVFRASVVVGGCVVVGACVVGTTPKLARVMGRVVRDTTLDMSAVVLMALGMIPR